MTPARCGHQISDFGAQVETASDDVIMAAEQAEDVDVDALERCLLAKQGALRLAAAKLQELQVNLLLLAPVMSCLFLSLLSGEAKADLLMLRSRSGHT